MPHRGGWILLKLSQSSIKSWAIKKSRFPKHQINFDLNDCDKILRVQGPIVLPIKIIEVLHAEDFECVVIE